MWKVNSSFWSFSIPFRPSKYWLHHVPSPRSYAKYKWHEIDINWIHETCFHKRQFLSACGPYTRTEGVNSNIMIVCSVPYSWIHFIASVWVNFHVSRDYFSMFAISFVCIASLSCKYQYWMYVWMSWSQIATDPDIRVCL